MEKLNEFIQAERGKIVDAVLLAFGVMVFFPVAASVSRAIDIGWKPNMSLHLVMCLLAWLLILFRKRIRYAVKAVFIVAIFTINGIAGVYQFGMIGNGMTVAILGPVLATLFFNLRVGVSILTLCGAAMMIIGFHVVQVGRMPVFSLSTYAISYKSWIDFVFAYFFVALVLTFTVAVLINKLISTLVEVNKRKLEVEEEIKILKGILPICSHCHEIRNDKGDWTRLEQYIEKHSDAQFSHSICDECLDKHYPEEDELK